MTDETILAQLKKVAELLAARDKRLAEQFMQIFYPDEYKVKKDDKN